ncbi:MAG: hypothetical protein KC777_01865 [Cyanobacteria bacterium HKST-UBA02]|nr:hypothetical protein [Cyanobacteria bacterium HKST-UBA02]
MNSQKSICLALSAAFVLASPLSALAKEKGDDWIKDTSQIGKSNGVIMSNQLLELGMFTGSTLRIQGEQALRLGDTDRAITVLQRSIEMEPLDMDGRILYASALEKKLLAQKERDPKLYNFVIKQWYFVSEKAEFADQKFQAIGHIQNLTGTLPKWYERKGKFLKRVLIPEDGSVKVAIGGGAKTQ